MSSVLIITEDVAKIQTFSGRLGKIYALIYQKLLATKLNLIIFLLKPKYDITVLSSDSFQFKSIRNLYYSQELSRDRFAKLKPFASRLTKQIAKSITQADGVFSVYHSIPLIKLWQNKISVKLMYEYFAYVELINRLLSSGQFDSVLILGKSLQEELAIFFAESNKLKLINFSYFNLNWINNWLINYFRRHELALKINNFKSQSSASKHKFESPRPTVFLSADFYRHLKTLVPIYLQCKKTKLNPVFVTDDGLIKTYLNNFQIKQPNYLFLASFFSNTRLDKYLRSWQKSIKVIHKKTKDILFASPRRLDKLILKLFFKELSPIINKGLALSRLYLISGDQLFNTLKPKSVVVVGDTRLVELTLSYLAKKYHVPSLTVSSRTIMFDEDSTKYDTTNLVSVAGEYARNKLLKYKVKKEKIFVCGDPQYDYFKELEKHFSYVKVRQQLKIRNPDKKIILLISFRSNPQLPIEEKRDFFLLASRAVKQLKNVVLVAKPHPTEKRGHLVNQLEDWGITNVVVSDNQKLELFDLLKVCSVVVLAWSMTGLEAMMFNRPVVILNPYSKNYDQFIPYLKNSAASQATSVEGLIKNIKILSNKNHPQRLRQLNRAKKFTSRYIHEFDGKASQRIVQLIQKNIKA
jgi:UDP-N-acetylglucosamine 2-epimerase